MKKLSLEKKTKINKTKTKKLIKKGKITKRKKIVKNNKTHNKAKETKTTPKKPMKEIQQNQKSKITDIKIVEETKNKNKSEIILSAQDVQLRNNMNVNLTTSYFTILFVCTGNMCRSPIAEGIMKKKIEEEFTGSEKDFIVIHSCGIYAYEGNKPSENAVKISKQNNTDISQVRSKSITKLLVEESDVILVMSVEHLNFIHDNFFSAKNKTHLLKLFGENRLPQMSDSIPDPMGFTIEYYAKTYLEIKKAIEKIFPDIREMITKKIQNKQ